MQTETSFTLPLNTTSYELTSNAKEGDTPGEEGIRFGYKDFLSVMCCYDRKKNDVANTHGKLFQRGVDMLENDLDVVQLFRQVK